MLTADKISMKLINSQQFPVNLHKTTACESINIQQFPADYDQRFMSGINQHL